MNVRLQRVANSTLMIQNGQADSPVSSDTFRGGRLQRILAVVIALSVAGPAVVCAARPNVLLIVCDDLNDSVEGFGGHPQTRTPCLNRFAATATRFQRACCNAPICAPSRSSFLTGIFPGTSGNYNFHKWFQIPVRKKSKTVMTHFKGNGFHVAGTGKLMHHHRRGEFHKFGHPGGTDAGHPVSLIDLYPTLVDLCSLKGDTRRNDQGRPLDGHSLRPFIEDPESTTWDGPDGALTVVGGGRAPHSRQHRGSGTGSRPWTRIKTVGRLMPNGWCGRRPQTGGTERPSTQNRERRSSVSLTPVKTASSVERSWKRSAQNDTT